MKNKEDMPGVEESTTSVPAESAEGAPSTAVEDVVMEEGGGDTRVSSVAAVVPPRDDAAPLASAGPVVVWGCLAHVVRNCY